MKQFKRGVCFCLMVSGNLVAQTGAHSEVSFSKYRDLTELIGLSKFQEAYEGFENLVEADMGFTPAYHGLVRAAELSANLNLAENFFRGALSSSPDSAMLNLGLAFIAMKRGDYDRAVDRFKRTLEFDISILEVYDPRDGILAAFAKSSRLDQASAYFERLQTQFPESALVSFAIAKISANRSDWQKATKWIKQALALDPECFFAIQTQVSMLFSRGQNSSAMERCKLLTSLSRKYQYDKMLGYSLLMEGNLYFYAGDFYLALQRLNESLDLSTKIGDRKRVGDCYNSIAAVFAVSGAHNRALSFLKLALEEMSADGSNPTYGYTLGNMGNLYSEQQQFEDAQEFYKKALSYARRLGDQSQIALVLSNFGTMYLKMGRLEASLNYMNRALAISRKVDNKAHEGYILAQIGALFAERRLHESAESYFVEALEVGEQIQDAQILWESHAALGALYEQQGEPKLALRHFASAIAEYDSVRAQLNIEALGTSFLEDKYEAYLSIIRLLAAENRIDEAYAYAQKYRSKTTMDILAQNPGRLGDPVADSLQQVLGNVRRRLVRAHTAQSAGIDSPDADPKHALALDQEITALQMRKSSITNALKKYHQAFYAIDEEEVSTPAALQRSVLQPGSALLDYLVGPKGLMIFVTTPESFHHFEIGVPRDSLRTLLASLSPLYESNADLVESAPEKAVTPLVADFKIRPASSLYDVLIAPLQDVLVGVSTLIVVPDDVLYYLPFELLVADASRARSAYDFENVEFLIERYTVRYTSSASMLAASTRRQPQRKELAVLALGNPDFSGHEGKKELGELFASKSDLPGPILRGTDLVPLPNSESEVKSIGRQIGANHCRILIGREASESRFKNLASKFSIIHLATHFLANDNQPLYSKIVLSQVDDPSEDGYLQTYEVMNMTLDASLAVLSACNTGLGKLKRGEGMIGISRAFLYAGVPSLVASLWAVDDASTADIMQRFYSHLQNGAPKSTALRKAKLEYIKESKRMRMDPFYWAPFVLLGDDAPVSLPKKAISPALILIGLVVLSLVLTAFITYKRRAHNRP